jgi:hypothetical protein
MQQMETRKGDRLTLKFTLDKQMQRFHECMDACTDAALPKAETEIPSENRETDLNSKLLISESTTLDSGASVEECKRQRLCDLLPLLGHMCGRRRPLTALISIVAFEIATQLR